MAPTLEPPVDRSVARCDSRQRADPGCTECCAPPRGLLPVWSSPSPLSTGHGNTTAKPFRVGSQCRSDSIAARYPQSEDRALDHSCPNCSNLSVAADRGDQMSTRSCVLCRFHNETIHLDSNFVERILHAPGEFQNTKALVSVLHSCFLQLSRPSKALQVTGRTRAIHCCPQVGILAGL